MQLPWLARDEMHDGIQCVHKWVKLSLIRQLAQATMVSEHGAIELSLGGMKSG
jgi:hypothetical protein